jgi:hypothetical protein
MSWGGTARWLGDAAAEAGVAIDVPLAPPPIAECLIPVREAFAHLSRGRGWGPAGPLPIQLVEVAAWFDLMGPVDPDDRLDHLTLLTALDDAWLGAWQRRVDQQGQDR